MEHFIFHIRNVKIYIPNLESHIITQSHEI